MCDPYADNLKWFEKASAQYGSAPSSERNLYGRIGGTAVRLGGHYDKMRDSIFGLFRHYTQNFHFYKWIPDYSGTEVVYTDGDFPGVPVGPATAATNPKTRCPRFSLEMFQV